MNASSVDQFGLWLRRSGEVVEVGDRTTTVRQSVGGCLAPVTICLLNRRQSVVIVYVLRRVAVSFGRNAF